MDHPSVARIVLNRIEIGSAHWMPPVDHDFLHLIRVARLHGIRAEDLGDLLVFYQLVADPFKRVL